MSARDEQIGGDHYKDAAIQPRDYAVAHGFEYEEVCVLRYLTRHRRKNGAEDIDKAIHCLQLLKERLYSKTQWIPIGEYVAQCEKKPERRGALADAREWLERVAPKHSGQMIGGNAEKVYIAPDKVPESGVMEYCQEADPEGRVQEIPWWDKGEPARYPHLHKGKPGA